MAKELTSKEAFELDLLKSIESESTTEYKCIMHFNNGFVNVDGKQMTENEFKAQYPNIDLSTFTPIILNLGKEI